MNRLRTILIISILWSGIFAYADSQKESYIDYFAMGLGIQDIINNDKFDQGTALIINAGKDIYSDISIEMEGVFTISKPEATFRNKNYDADFWSFGVYGAYIWRVNKLSIKPRLGIVYEHLKSDLNTNTNNEIYMSEKVRIKDLALSGGIGASYDIGENYKIYTNYTKYEDDINQLTFGAEYKF